VYACARPGIHRKCVFVFFSYVVIVFVCVVRVHVRPFFLAATHLYPLPRADAVHRWLRLVHRDPCQGRCVVNPFSRPVSIVHCMCDPCLIYSRPSRPGRFEIHTALTVHIHRHHHGVTAVPIAVQDVPSHDVHVAGKGKLRRTQSDRKWLEPHLRYTCQNVL